MNTTILCTYYYPYDETEADLPETYLASSAPELARHLAERSHRIRVISRQVPGTQRKTQKSGVSVLRVPFIDVAGLRFLTWFAAAIIAIMRNPDDRYVCWDWSTALPAIVASWFVGGDVFCSVRNSSQAGRNKDNILYPVYWLLEKMAYTFSDHVIYSSAWVKETVEGVMTVSTPSTVLHHGVDATMFASDVSGEEIREHYPLEEPVIGFFGRLSPIKGVEYLLEAARRLKDEGYTFTVFLVGDGPKRGVLERWTRENGLTEDVVFAGFQERGDIPRYMAACDIIVLPSFAEGFSSVVVEAMAMGKPFIGTAVGGVPEVIRDGENGFQIPPRDADALTQSLTYLVEHPDAREEIGGNARTYIENEYAWTVTVEKWESLLEAKPVS